MAIKQFLALDGLRVFRSVGNGANGATEEANAAPRIFRRGRKDEGS